MVNDAAGRGYCVPAFVRPRCQVECQSDILHARIGKLIGTDDPIGPQGATIGVQEKGILS